MAAAARAVLALKMKKNKMELMNNSYKGGINVIQRHNILTTLNETEELSFICDLAGFKEEKPEDTDELLVEWDDFETAFPADKPHFLSERHYVALQRHVEENKVDDFFYLLDAYHKDSPPKSERPKMRHVKSIQEIQSSSIKEEDEIKESNTKVHRLNEFIFFNQMLVHNHHFNALIVFCILVAGVLVGLQSYPKLSEVPTLENIDTTVQIVFSFECVFKILAEGVKPHLYWLLVSLT
mmetsp:Transcript_4170/g.5315  ORF Transcript_4170/g.5315 Transcript_4170/m.5315 type:complete len:238 (-) Transcript_4170:395-1108(-)